MILINVSFPVRADRIGEWMTLATEYRDAVNAEDGNVYFEWSRGLTDPNTFVTIELFADADAGAAHTRTPHFERFVEEAPALIAGQPQIIYVDDDAIEGWGPMGEIQPEG